MREVATHNHWGFIHDQSGPCLVQKEMEQWLSDTLSWTDGPTQPRISTPTTVGLPSASWTLYQLVSDAGSVPQVSITLQQINTSMETIINKKRILGPRDVYSQIFSKASWIHALYAFLLESSKLPILSSWNPANTFVTSHCSTSSLQSCIILVQ